MALRGKAYGAVEGVRFPFRVRENPSLGSPLRQDAGRGVNGARLAVRKIVGSNADVVGLRVLNKTHRLDFG